MKASPKEIAVVDGSTRCDCAPPCSGVWVALLVVLLLAIGPVIPGAAVADEYKCEDHVLEDGDEMRLRAAALKALPKQVHLAEVAPCRNPEIAHAWIETRKTTTADAVSQWWEFTCKRATSIWQCDPPEFKQSIALRLAVGEDLRLVELNFEKGVSLGRAKLLAS